MSHTLLIIQLVPTTSLYTEFANTANSPYDSPSSVVMLIFCDTYRNRRSYPLPLSYLKIYEFKVPQWRVELSYPEAEMKDNINF